MIIGLSHHVFCCRNRVQYVNVQSQSRVAQNNRFVPIKLAATRQSNNFNSQFSWKNLRNVCSPYLISPLLLVQMSTLKYRFISAILLPYVFTLKGRWALEGLHSSPLKLSRNTGKAFFGRDLTKFKTSCSHQQV